MPVRLLSRSGVEGDGLSPRETSDIQSQLSATPGILRHNVSMGALPTYDATSSAGWVSTMTKDDARDKAVSSHETMGLVSALLAGFELQALVEVELCDDACTGAESAFIVCSSYCVGLSMIVVLETSFEYMFVMRELHHGHASAWNLIRHFRYCRRIAEAAFALVILMFLISTGLMVHVRFARSLVVGTIFSHVLLGVNFCVVFYIVYAMQHAKIQHGEGSKIKREEARAAALRRQEEETETRARTMRDPNGVLPASSGLPHKLKAAGMKVGSLKRISTIFAPGEMHGRQCFGEASSDGMGFGGGAAAACTRFAGAGPSGHVAFPKEARLSLLRGAKSVKLCRRCDDGDGIGLAVANPAALKRAATAGSLNSVDLTREHSDDLNERDSARSALSSCKSTTTPAQSQRACARSDASGECGSEVLVHSEGSGEASEGCGCAQSSAPRGSVMSLDIGGMGLGPASPTSGGAARPGCGSGVASGSARQPTQDTSLDVNEAGQPDSPRAGRSDSVMMGV